MPFTLANASYSKKRNETLSRAVIVEGNLQAIHFVRLVTSLPQGNYPREMRVLKLAVIMVKNIKVGRYYERLLSTGDVRGGRNSFWKKGKDDFCGVEGRRGEERKGEGRDGRESREGI